MVHCSDSGWGDAAVIDEWHRARDFAMIGYHLVVLNGYRKSREFNPDEVGMVEKGREENLVGSHVRGYNRNSLGICYIGNANNPPTDLMLDVLTERIIAWMDRYGVDVENVVGHTELDSGKSCPDLDMYKFRARLQERIRGGW